MSPSKTPSARSAASKRPPLPDSGQPPLRNPELYLPSATEIVPVEANGNEFDTEATSWVGLGPDPAVADAQWRAEMEVEERRTRAMIEKGDVRGLFGEILECDSPYSDFREMFAELAQATRKRGEKDPSGLVGDTLAEAQTCLSYVLLRTAHIVHRRIGILDKSRRVSAHDWLPLDIQEKAVPFLAELARSLAELEQLRASTERLRRLAQPRQETSGRHKKAGARNTTHPVPLKVKPTARRGAKERRRA